MYRVMKEAQFSASHHLRNYNGKCERMHGHNWLVQVVAEGEKLKEGGMLVDFGKLKAAMMTVLDRLDHNDLNTMEPFTEIEPSAENIACYVCEEVAAVIDRPGIRISEVRVWETSTSRASYIRE